MKPAARKVLALADRDRDHKDVAWADIYHFASRYSTGPAAHVPIVLPSSTFYSFQRNRLVLGICTASSSCAIP